MQKDFPKVDIISLIFVLSSVSPEKQINIIQNLKPLLKVGASIVVRDYGAYDHAMIRFGHSTKIDDRFYTRHDGTRAYFFFIGKKMNVFKQKKFFF